MRDGGPTERSHHHSAAVRQAARRNVRRHSQLSTHTVHLLDDTFRHITLHRSVNTSSENFQSPGMV